MGKLIVYRESAAMNWQFGAWFPKLNSNFIAALDSTLHYKIIDLDIPEDTISRVEPEAEFDDDDIPSNPELA
jgi:hypothetical protein